MQTSKDALQTKVIEPQHQRYHASMRLTAFALKFSDLVDRGEVIPATSLQP
jgi:hypothetical protein